MKLRFFLLLNFLLCSSLFAQFFPESLSAGSTVSIVNVDYTKSFKEPFSKVCLRFSDNQLGLDEIVDFSYFEDFNDPLFALKFYLFSKKARIASFKFSDFIEENSSADISEFTLDLTGSEKVYIYNFLKTIISAMPDYSYHYDILKNNSYTQISRILNDCYRYFNYVSSDRSFVSETVSFVPSSKTDLFPYSSYKQKSYNFNFASYKLSLPKTNIRLIVTLLVFSFLLLVFTVYQTIVIFKPFYYRSSVFYTLQSVDFILLFLSGSAGLFIFFQDLFSSQSLFTNNFQWIFLFPLNILLSFNLFIRFTKSIQLKIYWTSYSILTILYFIAYFIVEREIPALSLLVAAPLLLRSIYFALKEYFRKVSVRHWLGL